MCHRDRGKEPGGDQKREGTDMGSHVAHVTHGRLPVTGNREERSDEARGEGPRNWETGCVPDVVGRSGIGISRRRCVAGY